MMTDIELSAQERYLIERSFDLESTKRRIRFSLGTATVLAGLLLLVGLYSEWHLTLVLGFVAYIAVTSYERWAYGRAVLLYKSVVSKLWSSVEGPEAVQQEGDR